MHEKIKIATRRMICDVCGGAIHFGERYRSIKTEYNPTIYREHIRCPGSAVTAEVKDPRPIQPRINFNHAMCMA